MKPLAWLGALVLACAACTGFARAEPVQFDCADLAKVIDQAALLRDLGANLRKVLDFGQKNSGLKGPKWDVIEREIRRMWTGGQARERATIDVYRRCQAQLGDMGRDG